MGLALIWLSCMVLAYTIGRTRPLLKVSYRLQAWGERNSSRHLPWYRKHTADVIGLVWIGVLFATHPLRTWRRLREYRTPTPRAAAPVPKVNWPDGLKES